MTHTLFEVNTRHPIFFLFLSDNRLEEIETQKKGWDEIVMFINTWRIVLNSLI